MEQSQLSWITNFIWGIADDVLRDLYVRGKYRDVILPMTVLRRLDALLEEAKPAVLDMKAALLSVLAEGHAEPDAGRLYAVHCAGCHGAERLGGAARALLER